VSSPKSQLSLIPQSSRVADFHGCQPAAYSRHDVDRSYCFLTDHEHLRTTYERMLEPPALQVKPGGGGWPPPSAGITGRRAPPPRRWRRTVATASEYADLLVSAGISKTHFAKKLAELLGSAISRVG
jgi:ATP-dependent Lon protease